MIAEVVSARRVVLATERRRRILEELRERGSVTVGLIEELCNVSSATARRDLTLLTNRGYARRAHGGAILSDCGPHQVSHDGNFGQGVVARGRVAGLVSNTIGAGETVFIDSSRAAHCVLIGIIDAGVSATVLTNSVPVMSLVAGGDAPNLELICLGGNFRKQSRSFVGADVLRAVERFYVDRVIFSVSGIEADGSLTDQDPLESEVKRAILARTRSAILVIGARRLEGQGFNVVGRANEVNKAWIADPCPSDVRVLEASGVEVSGI